MEMVLIPGLWLDGSVWSDVTNELVRFEHRGIPVTLPGQGDGSISATLEDQHQAVMAVIEACDAPPLVVGHSAAASLAWMAGDAATDGRVAGVVFIGGFPEPDGAPYAPFFACAEDGMHFPGWEKFEGPDSADLDRSTKARMERAAIPVPEGVCTGLVHLTDDRRYDLPVTRVCPEFTPEDARAWIAAGDLPELAAIRRLRFANLDSGHWPMITRPYDLAVLLDEAVTTLEE